MMTVDSAAKDDSRNEAGYERPDGILSRPSSSVNLFGKTLSAKQVADEDSCHERRRQNLDTPAGVRSGAPYWYNYPAAIGRTSERCADRGEETSEDGVIPIKSIDSVSQCSGISNGGSTVEVEKEGKEGLTGLRSGCKAASIRHKISQWEERSGDGPGATWGRGPEVDGGTSRMLDWKKNISSRYQAPNNRPLQPNRDNDLGGRLQAKICEAGKSCTRNGDPQGHSSRIYSTRERLGVSLSFREASQHFLACSKNDSASESAAPINCENQIKNPPRVCKKELKEVSMKSPDSIGQVSVGLCEERVMRQHTSSKAQKDQCDDSAKGPQSKNIMLEKGRCKKNVYDWSPTVRPCMDSKEEIEEKEQKRKILLESDDSCNIPAIWNRNEANSENNFACVSLALNKNLQQHEDKGSSITTSKGKGNHYNMGIQLNRPSSTDSRAQNCVQSTFEVEGYPIHTETCPSKEPKPSPTHTAVSTKHRSSKETSVLLRVQALEAAAKTSPNQGVPEMPGLYYSMDSLGSKSRGSQDSGESRVLRVPKAQHRRGSSETTASETDYSTIDSPSGHSLGPLDMENIYTDPGSPSPPSPSSPLTTINPLPKPRRTFEYRTGARRAERPSRRFHSNRLVLPATPPPLPSTPAPALCRNNSVGPARCRYGSHRRSFEFEDLPNRTQPESGGSGSEENIYEDILDPSRENPYEDVAEVIPGSGLSDVRCPVTLSPTCLSQTRRPLNVSGPTMSDPLRRAQMRFNPHCNAHSSPSNLEEFNIMELPTTNKLVQKINSVFTAKRGKKRWKKYSVSSPESCSMKDENSDSESDSDERLKEHTVRLAHMASLRRNLRGQRTLERELLERQQRQLFEYFVVVALRKKAHAASCLPELTYQFPKLERLTKEVREAEERLRAIPQFCFPDAKEWSPLTDFPSETFSFVLTYEDGTRRFGYCRRLLPSGKGPRLPEVYCIISRLGCFNLFSTILDEVEKRRQVSSALVYPFMRALLEATVPAPGRSIRVKSFMPDSGNEGVELRRPADSRLEHIDFSCLLSCLGTRHLLRLFASLLLERRVILTADKLSTLSKCGHAIVALLYPFTWQHTYIPVLPVSMLDIVCAPTPFLIGLLSSALPRLHSLPIEEVLVVDLCSDRFLKQMEDEDSILPRKLHSAMEHLLDQMEEIVTQEAESSDEEEAATPTDGTALDMLVSETFVRFFVEVLGHYSLHMSSTERGERTFQRESFRKSVASKSIRRFLEVFMQTQMFAGFVHDRELRKAGVRGLFELRAAQFLEENSEAEISGVNKFLKGLGNKMRFLSKKY